MPACELTLWFCKDFYKQLNPTYLTGLLIEYLQGFDFSVNWLHKRPCSIFYTLKTWLALKLKKKTKQKNTTQKLFLHVLIHPKFTFCPSKEEERQDA